MKGNTLKVRMIREFIKKNKLTDEEFCETSKIDKEDFNKLMVLNYDFPIEVLLKLARILKIEIYQLFE